jgi:hypothetical protein
LRTSVGTGFPDPPGGCSGVTLATTPMLLDQ